jgi:penicillin-binding protein A
VIPPESGTASGTSRGKRRTTAPRAGASSGRGTRRPVGRPPSERSRRLRHRAIPIAIAAAVAFTVGLVTAAGSAEEDTANRFTDAWAEQDFAAMHEELSPESQEQVSVEQLAAAYSETQDAASVESIDPGDVRGPEDGVITVDVGVETRIFGRVDGELALPFSGEKIVWAPHLTFPGLAEGERVGRRLTLGDRAAIVAADGTPLARGQGGQRGSRLGSSAIDVTGLVETPDDERRAQVEATGLPGDQPTGVSGLELAFNPRLAGKPGGELLAVPEGTDLPDVDEDTDGRVLATAQQAPGQDVPTTIDPDLQEVTVAALGGRSGGAVALDARTGAVKAIAGSAYSLLQPPGSTFKVITATAALEDQKVKLDDTFPVVTELNPAPDTGARVIENAHDELCGGSFEETFAESCNTVFAPLGVDVGAEKLVSEAEEFGFNEEPTLYNAEATAATQPPAQEMPSTFDETGTELSVSAIGQGTVLATTLGMASVAQTIANGGVRSPTPMVSDPALQSSAEPVQVTSRENARVMRSLMEAVVDYGTGSAAAISGVQVAGKTGTAELGPKPGQPPAAPGSDADPEQIVDAWFICFAPARKPKLAVAVMLVDADGDGGTVAAPVAREILAAGL